MPLNDPRAPNEMPLNQIRVIDASTLLAGPLAATMLGDYGADVIKVEHPENGDPARHHGYAKDGVGLWWKLLGRNKRTVTLNLSQADGAEVFLRLARTADVVIENFRPGTLERWGLGYETLMAANPGLVLARVTTFGQEGPYARQPGFGTLAEAMSGFAHVTGPEDGPPTLPPFGLADGIAGLTTAYAVMVALHARAESGEGQMIDMAIVDPIITVVGAAPIAYDQLGIVQTRMGNRSINNAPRNTYRTADGRWVAISTSASSIAERVLRLVGRDDLTKEPWFATGRQRAEHADELDKAVGEWIAERDCAEVVRQFEDADAAIARVYDAADIMNDPHLAARGTITSVADGELGSLRMQNILFKLSRTPGGIRWAGPPKGAHTEEVLTELGYSGDDLSGLKSRGAI